MLYHLTYLLPGTEPVWSSYEYCLVIIYNLHYSYTTSHFTCFEKRLSLKPCSPCLAGDLVRSEFLVFNPSKSLMSKMFDGNSSTGISTRVLHSGQRSSRLVPYISSKQRLQKVCWQGRTLLVWSNRSRHTEHSSSSFNDCSSILSQRTLLEMYPTISQWDIICCCFRNLKWQAMQRISKLWAW